MNLLMETHNSPEYYKIYNKIQKLIQQNPNIIPNQVYNKLILDGLINHENNISPINFMEAFELDKYFYDKGGSYWLNAYSRPHENQIINTNGELVRAYNCGIFTFDKEIIEDYDNIALFDEAEEKANIDYIEEEKNEDDLDNSTYLSSSDNNSENFDNEHIDTQNYFIGSIGNIGTYCELDEYSNTIIENFIQK